MSLTPPKLAQPGTSLSDTALRCDGLPGISRAIEWPELRLPPINLYNVPPVGSFSPDKPFSRD